MEISKLRTGTAADEREAGENAKSAGSLFGAMFEKAAPKILMAAVSSSGAAPGSPYSLARFNQGLRASDLYAPSYQRPPDATVFNITINITINVTSDTPADSESQEPQHPNGKATNGDQS